MNLHFPQYGQKESYDIVSEIFKVLLVVASQAKKKGKKSMERLMK